MSTEKFTWCREVMGSTFLIKWNEIHNLLFTKIKQVEEWWVVLYSMHDIDGQVNGQLGWLVDGIEVDRWYKFGLVVDWLSHSWCVKWVNSLNEEA